MLIHKKLPKLDLNITNKCNFRCIHCAFDSGITKMNELSVNKIKTILQDTKDLGGERIDITGGEPTLIKELEEIIKIGKSLNYKIELVTNGSLINKNDLIKYKDIGLDSIAISLDGSNYNTYSKIRRENKETYNNVLKTIDEAINLDFYTKINTVVFNSNLEDLVNIVELCIKKEIRENGIYYFTPIGRGYNKNELSVEPMNWLNFIRNNLSKYSSKIKISLEFPLIEKSFSKKDIDCLLEDPYHLQILPNGNVYPCAILASHKKPIASLYNKSVKEIWNDQPLWQDYYKKISSEIFKKFNGSCIDFNIEKYSKEYKFVCPLRKFSIGDII